MTGHPHALREEEDFYDACGERYDTQVRALNLEAAYPQLIAYLHERMGPLPGKRVLDVGCGSGEFVAILSECGADACGIDRSCGQVARGRERGRPLEVGAMEDIPFPDDSFDAVISYHSFNYAPFDTHAKVLAEQHRVLRPRGCIVLAGFHVTTPYTEPVLIPMFNRTITLYPRTSEELMELFQDCGFSRPRCTAHFFSPAQTETAIQRASEDAEQVRTILADRPYALFTVAHKE